MADKVKSKAHWTRLEAMSKTGEVTKDYFRQATEGVSYDLLPDKLPPGRQKRR